jgi:hypothetical protein
MGFFGTYQFDGTAWSEGDPDAGPTGPEPWLWLDIYDSDFVTIRYAPAGSGTGIAFLNQTPRIYFQRDGASAPTDVDGESLGLAEWWTAHHRGASVDEQGVRRREIATLLASDVERSDEDFEDDADIFAEVKATRFLSAMDLPLPDDLTERSA